MYKLVALDLDGTLLNDQQEIPPENTRVIKELTKKGIHFVVVTGRSDSMAKSIVDTLGIDAPILGNNGASIRNIRTNKLLYLSALSLDTVELLYNFFKKNKSYARWYGLDAVYSFNANEFDEQTNPYAKFSKKLAEQMDFHILEDFSELREMNPTILRCMYVHEDNAILQATLHELKQLVSEEIFQTSPISLDVVAKDTSKGSALESYGEMIGTTLTEMIAIGDSGNDISMLKAVGMPVTLANGHTDVKKISRLIAKSNNAAGVADALKTLFEM